MITNVFPPTMISRRWLEKHTRDFLEKRGFQRRSKHNSYVLKDSSLRLNKRNIVLVYDPHDLHVVEQYKDYIESTFQGYIIGVNAKNPVTANMVGVGEVILK